MLKITLIVSFIAGFVNLPSQAQNTLRQQYVLKLYDGKPVPKLWVPLLSHFQEDGLSIDTNRTKRHLQEIAQNVGGVLIPGSTGEGWEMELPARLSLLEQVLPLIKDNELAISIGILRTSSERVFSDLDSITARLMVWSQKKQLKQALDYYNIKGFTICNPKGTNISQDLLIAFWEKVLTLGYPMIFYQLPQVTGNELNVNSLVYLSKKYPNLYMIKDTSGEDHLAKSREKYNDLHFVRGYEGKYYEQLKINGGNYNGFLLGTANVFSKELSQVLTLSVGQQSVEAKKISDHLDKIIQPVFKLASEVPHSNAFTITNKAFDHFKAHGVQPPQAGIKTLYKLKSIPIAVLEAAYKALDRSNFSEKGYLK